MNVIPEKRHVHFNILKDYFVLKNEIRRKQTNKQTNKQTLFQLELCVQVKIKIDK